MFNVTFEFAGRAQAEELRAIVSNRFSKYINDALDPDLSTDTRLQMCARARDVLKLLIVLDNAIFDEEISNV